MLSQELQSVYTALDKDFWSIFTRNINGLIVFLSKVLFDPLPGPDDGCVYPGSAAYRSRSFISLRRL